MSSAWTSERKREYEREYYKNNVRDRKDRVKAHRERRKDEYKDFIWEYLLNHPCVDCGEADPVVLEFDHLPGSEKRFALGKGWDYTQAAVLEEIAKCEVRCSNCHRRVTTTRMGGWRAMRL
jgi:hypothetical protein